jgi:hypothetical protein
MSWADVPPDAPRGARGWLLRAFVHGPNGLAWDRGRGAYRRTTGEPRAPNSRPGRRLARHNRGRGPQPDKARYTAHRERGRCGIRAVGRWYVAGEPTAQRRRTRRPIRAYRLATRPGQLPSGATGRREGGPRRGAPPVRYRHGPTHKQDPRHRSPTRGPGCLRGCIAPVRYGRPAQRSSGHTEGLVA